MKVRTIVVKMAATVTAIVMAWLPAAESFASDVCDRTCLTGLVDKYLAALLAHDPSQLPLARVVRFTENGQELRLGDGLWGTATAPGKYRLYVADPEDGQVGLYGTVIEGDNPVLMALRLKVEYGHDGRLKEMHLTNGQTVPSPVRAPLTLEISELFQIDHGKIDQVEAVLQSVPYGMRSAAWDLPPVTGE